MKACYVAALLIITFRPLHSWTQEVEGENVPSEVAQAVDNAKFAHSYALDGSINPFYLRADFDGDGKPDYALRIRSRADTSVGIAIWLSSLNRFVVIGAGVPVKISGTAVSNLAFLNTWQVYGRRAVERGVGVGRPPHLIGDAILAGKRESASGLIYWNRKSFVWYQQGD